MIDALLGTCLGTCKLESLLARDDSYLVFRALHTRLKRATVIRVLHPSLAATPAAVAGFQDAAAGAPGARAGIFNLGHERGLRFVETREAGDGWPNLAALAPP